MWDLRATVAPRRFLGARAVATPAESQAKQSTETGRARAGCWCNGELVLKKSPSWCLRGRQQQGYKQTRVSDAAGNRHSRRLAAYDGATRPFGVAVLLLPHRRS